MQPHTTQLSEYAQRQLSDAVIDLAAGQPGPSLLPLQHIADAAAHRLAGSDAFILQYGPEQGYASFRACLAEFLTQETGHEAAADDLLITAGVSHGLDLVCRHLASPGDHILLEQPTYFLAGSIIRQAGLVPVPIPTGPEGMDVDALQQLLEAPGAPRPRLCYIIPVHGNPTGATLPTEQRRRLIQLARKHAFLVAADEVYQLLSFPGSPAPPPPMRAIERAMAQQGAFCSASSSTGASGGSSSSSSSSSSQDAEHSCVVSLGSFSKIMAPGLRLGWIDAAPYLLQRIRQDGVLGSGGSIAPLASGIAHSCLLLGSLQQHLHGTIRPSLERSCAALCQALQQELPQGCRFRQPRGGYFIWVQLPDEVCSQDLLAFAADQYGVRFLPGRVCDGVAHMVRLSFAFYTPRELQEGAQRLGAAISAFMQRSTSKGT